MKSTFWGVVGSFYIPFLYFFPATLLGLGSGIFSEDIPGWYKAARFLVILGLVGCHQLKFKPPLIFLLGLLSVAIFHFDGQWVAVFLLSIILIYVILNFDFASLSIKHFYILSSLMILAGMAEVFQLYDSPHSYAGVTRVVSTLGGPNNAGIVSAAFCLFFLNKFKQGYRYLDLVYSVLSLLILFLTGSISSLIAFALVSIYVDKRIVLIFLLTLLLTLLDPSSYIFLKFENIYEGIFYGESSLSRTTVDRLDMIQNFIKIITTPAGFIWGADYVAESDGLNVFGRFGFLGFAFFLMFICSLNFSIYLSLGMIQSLFTPFWFSFPSLSIILFISEYVRKNGYGIVKSS